MNYNANNVPARQPGPRKPKRVSDVNAIGPTLVQGQNAFMPMPMTNTFQQQQQPQSVPSAPSFSITDPNLNQFSGNVGINTNPNYGFNVNQDFSSPNEFNSYPSYPAHQGMSSTPMQSQQQGFNQQQTHQQQQPSIIPPQFSMFQQPMVQDMAMQYGQKLADQGKEIVNKEFEKYIPVTRLKYYFAVDNKYVINKLRLIFFPFTHTDWTLKYDQDSPVQPRYDINAPDLYIPVMAYVTYVVLAGLLLAMQNRFSPEQLGIQASSALAYSIFELLIYLIILYVVNIPTTLKTLDLIAFTGYKYAIIVSCCLCSILFHKTGYYLALIYSGLTLAFFLLRTLKSKIMEVSQPQPASSIGFDAYGVPQQQQQHQQQFDYNVGRKRKLYFLFLVAGLQPLLAFWLSMHLIPTTEAKLLMNQT